MTTWLMDWTMIEEDELIEMLSNPEEMWTNTFEILEVEVY